MEFSVLISTVALMAILIISGIILARFTEPTMEVRRFMMTLIINVALPSIILYGIFQLEVDAHLFRQVVLVFISALVISVGGLFITYGVARLVTKDGDKAPEIAFLGGLGNTGIVGIPLCTALFGAKGALFAAIFDTGMCITLWTLGVYILNRKHPFFSRSSIKAVLTPPLMAAVCGLILAALNIRPTGIIYKVVESFAHLTAPLSMMYIGLLIYLMYKNRSFQSPFKLLTVPLAMKLLILPALVLLVLTQVTIDETLKLLILVQATMPSLTTASIVMARFGRDENFAALSTLASMIISLLTIPGMLLLGRLILF